MCLQKRGDSGSIVLLALGTHGQRLDAPQKEPAGKWRQRRALGILQKGHTLGQLLGVDAHHTTRHVRVAAQKLCARVYHNVCAQTQRVLQVGAHHGVVHRKQHPRAVLPLTLPHDPHQPPNVRNLHQRVGRRLKVNQTRVLGQGRLQRFGVGHVNNFELDDAGFDGHLSEEPVHAAVNVIANKNLAAWFHGTRHHVESSHASVEGKRCMCMFKQRNLLFQCCAGGVATACVVIGSKHSRAGLNKCCRLINGHVGRMMWVVRAAVKGDHLRCEVQRQLKLCVRRAHRIRWKLVVRLASLLQRVGKLDITWVGVCAIFRRARFVVRHGAALAYNAGRP
eukprot:m.30656 g.30656  ORF g.30656 m.30656 type:complete len:336 (+) comp9504_c0_seq1:457-1464(+)